jgi:hypothetical protein
MTKLIAITILAVAAAVPAAGQLKSRPKTNTKSQSPTVTRTNSKAAITSTDKGTVSGRTYTNNKFGFEITFPDAWLIPGHDFEEYMKSQGFDLSLKAPDSLTPAGRASLNSALKKVKVLLTAYRSMPGTADNAIMRASVEDLVGNPQVKDAVDYLDAMRASFITLKLPPDFHYSETGAEQLGTTQFAYLDLDSKAGKKRMYATVRNGFAILFTLSYTSADDLATMRRVLDEGTFHSK